MKIAAALDRPCPHVYHGCGSPFNEIVRVSSVESTALTRIRAANVTAQL